MANIGRTPGHDTLTGGNGKDTIDRAERDDLLPGGGGGDFLEGSAINDALIGNESDGDEPRERGVAPPISATPSTASSAPTT